MIIHDLDSLDDCLMKPDDIIINRCPNSCVGCFSCWTKHPMQCLFNDELQNNGKKLLECDTLLIISRCICGCYSSIVKQVLERSIGYVEPFFTLRNGEIHHQSRGNQKLNLVVYFYGDIEEKTKKITTELVHRNGRNLNSNTPEIHFISDIKTLGEYI